MTGFIGTLACKDEKPIYRKNSDENNKASLDLHVTWTNFSSYLLQQPAVKRNNEWMKVVIQSWNKSCFNDDEPVLH